MRKETLLRRGQGCSSPPARGRPTSGCASDLVPRSGALPGTILAPEYAGWPLALLPLLSSIPTPPASLWSWGAFNQNTHCLWSRVGRAVCSQGAKGPQHSQSAPSLRFYTDAGQEGSSHFCKDTRTWLWATSSSPFTMSEPLPHDKANIQKQGQEMGRTLNVNDVV